MARDLDWAEKHRPKTLADLVGNKAAIEAFKAWAESWKDGPPEQRAVILAGPPGVGKTSAAHAIARDMGWGVVELNASDQRNYEAVKRVALQGAVHRGFGADGSFASDARTLVILDEADNLFGQEDRGGMKAITETLRQAQNPVVLIANDWYELTRRASALRDEAISIKFTRVHSASIPNALRRVAKAENVVVEPEAMELLVAGAGGDMRSAINDLQAVAIGRETVTAKDVEALGRRDVQGDIWQALGKIFYGTDADEARKSTWNLDEDPESVALWVDENLPIMYEDKADLVDGYARLSKADVYLGRAKRRQQFGLWSYAGTLMTAGVATAKHARPSGARFVFPSWLRKQSQTKGLRETRDRLSRAMYQGHDPMLHTSLRRAREDFLPFVRAMMERDEEFAAMVAHRMRLEKEDVAWLLGEKPTTARVKAILARADALGPRPAPPSRFAGAEEDEEEAPEDVPAAKPAKAETPAKPDKPGRKSADKAAPKGKSLFEF